MRKFRYAIHLRFLGFRYHGWQRQPHHKTVQAMLEKTLSFIFEHDKFKTLGASRTDAMVSANHHVSELFSEEQIEPETLLQKLNDNLPPDIQALRVDEVGKEFLVINGSKMKEYLYFFAFGEKMHPFCAPYLANFHESLDIELMKKCAKIFEGEHNFRQYCYRAKEGKQFIRTIETSEIVENTMMSGTFFPKNNFMYRVKGAGFLHHQVRLMIGTLIRLGLGEITEEDIIDSLKGKNEKPIGIIAPSSGLMLYKTDFDNLESIEL